MSHNFRRYLHGYFTSKKRIEPNGTALHSAQKSETVEKCGKNADIHENAENQVCLERKIGFLGAVAVIMGIIIGKRLRNINYIFST